MSRRLPSWALPPIALVVVLAVLGFPFRWAWERLSARAGG